VVHVPEEHDYLLQSEDFREKILETLCFAYYNLLQKKMAFYYRVDNSKTNKKEAILFMFLTKKSKKKFLLIYSLP